MVRRFFKRSTAIFFRRQTTIISAAAIMMFLVMASRVLGLVRNRFLAHFFPIETLDAYKAAFVVPDFLANILITGVLSVAFIPVFTSYFTSKNEKEGWRVASSTLNIALLFFAIFAALLLVFAGPINENLVVPGFSDDPEKLTLTNNLTRLILAGELLLIIGSFFTSVLQSFHRFIIPALAPVLYNLGVIVGILWLRPYFGLMGVAWGVILGAIFHVLIQFALSKRLGFKYKFEFKFKDPGVLRILKLALPRSASIGLAQAEWWVSIFLSSLLVSGGFAGSVAYYVCGRSFSDTFG
jgi:putative peptidoglycan lipid II flippase